MLVLKFPLEEVFLIALLRSNLDCFKLFAQVSV